MKQEVKIGQTDYTVLVLIRDSTTGAPKTALTNASAGIDICYTRVETDNDVVLTAGAPVALATPALTDVHLDWGFLKVDDTNAPGLYRLDLPDGVFAAGAWSAVVSLICTGCDPVHLEFVLVPEAPYSRVTQTGDAYAALTAAQAEPGQAAPAANASVVTKLAYLYKAWRNKKTQTADTFALFNDAKDTVDQKAAVSDAAGTLTVDEIASGP